MLLRIFEGGLGEIKPSTGGSGNTTSRSLGAGRQIPHSRFCLGNGVEVGAAVGSGVGVGLGLGIGSGVGLGVGLGIGSGVGLGMG